MKKTDDLYNLLLDQKVSAVLAMTRVQANYARLGYSGYRTLFYPGGSQDAQRAAAENAASAQLMMQRLTEAEAAAPFWSAEIAPFRRRAAQAVEKTAQAVRLGMQDRNADAAELMRTIDADAMSFNSDVAQWADQKNAQVKAFSVESTKRTISTIILTLGLLLVATVATVLASLFVISKGITGPLAELRDRMTRLANADFTAEVIGQDRKDEIGQMARTVQVFKENGIRARDLDAEATRLREESERERVAVAREQEKVVAQLADGLSRLSDGDLAFTLNERFGEEYEKLRADFNAAMSKLKQTMQTVSGNTHGIRGGADEISQAADDLSRRTEQQAASLEETAAALDEITATVRTTAENANEARRVVAEASESAKHSGEVVGQAVEAMAKIEKSSQQISQIIGVIDEIAFQTNLLALNAGVEAARAGDAGRGFAVVASEVRALAQRSAEAAKEIKTLISASSVQVDQGVSLVAETGNALKGIVDQVSKINHLVADIAASAQEQATGLQQVNTAVNQMDQVTQQNAAMVEESTAASHSLAQETEQLSRLIGQFRTGAEDTPATATARRRPPPAAPQRPAQTTHTTHTALKTTGRGGAAPKYQQQPAEDGWEEF